MPPQAEDDVQRAAERAEVGRAPDPGGDGRGDAAGLAGAAAQRRVEQRLREPLDVAARGGRPLVQRGRRGVAEGRAVGARLDQRGEPGAVGVGRVELPDLLQLRVGAGRRARLAAGAGDAEDAQPVQRAAALQAPRGGQLQRDPAAGGEAEPFQLGGGVVDERRRGRVAVQAADAVPAQRGHHLGDRGVRARREGAARRPRQPLVEVLADQRGHQPVEQVGACGRAVPAQPGEALGEGPRGDQVGGRHHLPALAQPRHDRLGQRGGGAVRAVLPEPLVVLRRRHAGLVAGERVEPPERVRDEEAAARRALLRRGDLRPSGAAGAGEGFERGLVEPAGHHDDRPVPRVGPRRADPRGHVRLARGVVGPRLRFAAYQVEVRVEARGQVVGVDLEQVVPQHVGVVDGELAAQPLGGVGVAALGVGVPVAALGERGMPRGQVDEPQLRAGGPARVERRPFRRVVAERRPRRVHPLGVPVEAVDRDRRRVAEEQLVQPPVEVGGALDEHVRGAQPRDGVADEPRARRAVVPDADERDGHQPGSRCRAACSAFHCSPSRRPAACSR
ncbi:hypothetical protein amrb99_43900 [Actinomadura sp. RB99]|nr:hypothetical protein [Actinomadura sp. RB99]